MKLRYVTGNAVKPEGDGKKLILHVCNDEGGWGSGFVLALNNEFGTADGSPRSQYNEWYDLQWDANSKSVFKLGQIQFVKVSPDTTVVNMIGQSTPGGYKGFAPIRYQSLEECLLRVRDAVASYKGALSLHMPRIAMGLGGCKDWTIIEDILKRVFSQTNLTITVYDFQP
jgi:O-acetyl-ADP-ribose deacetylase (regulator of RNase III)